MTIAGECSRIFWHIKWNVPGRNGSVLTAGIPDSKTCSCCGNIKEDLQLSDRIYECACGNRMDRDQKTQQSIYAGKVFEYLE